MSHASLRLVVAAATLIQVGACDRFRSPTAPRDEGLENQTLTIVGDASLAGPGATTQLTVLLSRAGGASQDVTAQCRWTVSPPAVASVTASGRVEAMSYGAATIAVHLEYSPLVAHVELRVAPPETFVVQGAMRTVNGTPFEGVRVSIESSAGGFETTTTTGGWYGLPARGDAVLRVEEWGYLPLRQRLSVGRDEQLDLVLESDGSLLSGLYRVTITASPRCDLPAPAMQRTFEAMVDEMQGGVFVEAMGYQFVQWAGHTGFTGTRDGQRVTFELRDVIDDDYCLVERIDGVGDLAYAGFASAKLIGVDLFAKFDGKIHVMGGTASCTAADHWLEMVRTGGGA